MSFAAIRTVGLSFGYGKGILLDHINMQIGQGHIYGLLGLNGAGKTTLMKLILGILSPQKGHAELFGRKVHPAHPEVFSRIGSLVSRPHLYPHLTAERQLQVHCAYRGLSPEVIPEVLRLVGMSHASHRLIRQFSTGMRRRLALAQALLTEPDLLLLDEPANGLDPEGIADVRTLLLDINRQRGTSILMSSHLLSEVEQTCTHVGILTGGTLQFEGSLEALRELIPTSSLDIETDNPDRAMHILKQSGISSRRLQGTAQLRISAIERVDIPDIIDLLRAEKIHLYRVEPRTKSLEELFFHISQSRSV